MILIVDDDDDIREAVADALVATGYEVKIARDGLEAIGVVRERKPDLILLDLMMPIMDGWAFFWCLKSDPTANTIRIVLTSTYAAGEAARLGVECLPKPFDLDALLAMVSRKSPVQREEKLPW